MTEFAGPEGPIRDVVPGMSVVDAAGETVGTVEDVRMADSGAVEGTDPASKEPSNPIAWVAEAFSTDSGMSQEARERLARLGFVRVDGKGLFSGHCYVEPGQIASVAGDEVRLSVDGDQLLR
ncbi:DUF2171 domain-containing protein [Myceligenerans salitolerans]|uniref:PRC-barrel domain-containing protein n=1 Tax=Myceligenerans salitolerans TaxID=1230528 RepID=A0ABS3IBA9_9MICO|nr:DUF2171 domain-containing protein [Myceligenerans salitolerans]MBO0610326.1 hypothetical protein [Myceligenerans salitolerans]